MGKDNDTTMVANAARQAMVDRKKSKIVLFKHDEMETARVDKANRKIEKAKMLKAKRLIEQEKQLVKAQQL